MNQNIYYNLPEAVSDKILDYLNDNTTKSEQHFAAKIFQNSRGNYVVSIINYELDNSSEGFDLLREEIIEKSNRKIKVGSYEIPLVIPEDLIFADIGKTKMPDGRIAKKRVVSTFDGFTIIFDAAGHLYEE